MKNNADLTVIVPVYNAEPYLEQCIHSILAQSYSSLKVLLIDDGSTDKSGIICDRFQESDKRVQVYHIKKGGPIVARSYGVEHAESEYITFVDSDDWIAEDMYEKLMIVLKKDNSDVVCSGRIAYYDNEVMINNPVRFQPGKYDQLDIITKIFPFMLWGEDDKPSALEPSLSTKIFKRYLLLDQYKKLKYENFWIGEDVAVVYPLLLEVKTLSIYKDCLYYQRMRDRDTLAPYIVDDDYYTSVYHMYNYVKKQFKRNKYYKLLVMQLDFYYHYLVEYKLRQYPTYKFGCTFIFPFDKVPKDCDIILYGAGMVGKLYKEQVMRTNYCNIILWVDGDSRRSSLLVDKVESFDLITFDYIVIALGLEEEKVSVKKKLIDMGAQATNIVI